MQGRYREDIDGIKFIFTERDMAQVAIKDMY